MNSFTELNEEPDDERRFWSGTLHTTLDQAQISAGKYHMISYASPTGAKFTFLKRPKETVVERAEKEHEDLHPRPRNWTCVERSNGGY